MPWTEAAELSRRRRIATVVAVGALVLAGCGGDDDDSSVARTAPSVPTSTGPTTAPPPSPPPQPGTVVTTGASEFGEMLFDATGQAIYLFEPETTNEPECYDACAVAWPPVLTDGAPQAAGLVRGDLLGTVARADGTTQVTYNGHPLYFYVNEGKYEVECHNVDSYGGLWFVVTPEGDAAPV